MITRLRSVRRDEQAGFTLVELLVTMTIMAIAFIVILGAISVFFSSTRCTARRPTSTRRCGRTSRSWPMRRYVDCATSTAYNAVPVPAGFTASVQPKYWDGINPNPAVYGPTCPTPATDKGAQQLTVTLTRNADGQQDSLVIVKRDEVQP